MGKKSTPKAPSASATAAAQTQSNIDTARVTQQLNMMDQTGPDGSVTYQQTGTWADGTPKYSQVTAYSPEQQAIHDNTQAAQTSISNTASQLAGQLSSTPFSYSNSDAEQWAYDLASPRILQQQSQNEADIRSTLANKGIREGSAAWNSEMQRLTNANTDQLNQLALNGRQQAYNEALSQHQQQYADLSALMGQSQVAAPNANLAATPTASVANTDVAGITNQAYQNQVAASQQQAQGIGGLFGSAASLGSTLFKAGMLSDRRAKEDIRRVGQTDAGLPIYTYRYKGRDGVFMGVMAQEAKEMFPDAVGKRPDGFLAVDYERIE